VKNVRILSEVADDLEKAHDFYDKQEEGAGSYFIEMTLSELQELSETAGIHPVFYGYHRKLLKKFPFAIYYRISKRYVDVFAILDLRSKPGFIYEELKRRF
jgi:hypothetical protein